LLAFIIKIPWLAPVSYGAPSSVSEIALRTAAASCDIIATKVLKSPPQRAVELDSAHHLKTQGIQDRERLVSIQPEHKSHQDDLVDFSDQNRH
jgi:hypothetical protein